MAPAQDNRQTTRHRTLILSKSFLSNDLGEGTKHIPELSSVPHFLQFLNDAVNPAGADQEHTLAQPADNVLGQLLVGQQLLGENGVLGLDQRDPAM